MLTLASGCCVVASKILPCMYTVLSELAKRCFQFLWGEGAVYFGILGCIEADVIALLSHWVILPEERAKNRTLGRDISGLCSFHIRDLIDEPARDSASEGVFLWMESVACKHDGSPVF